MTPLQLQRDLVVEIGQIICDVQTKNTSGDLVSGATGYKQSLPVLLSDDDMPDQFFPYFIVRLEEGDTEDDDSTWDTSVSILFGVFDEDSETDGHLHIMEMIQRTADRFTAEPLLNKMFRAAPKMHWALQDEDTYPYYFGGIEMKFMTPKIGRKEPIYHGQTKEIWD